MESLTSGTIAGTGSFRCGACGYVVTLAAGEPLGVCPGCGGEAFTRASLFSTPRFERDGSAPSPEERRVWLQQARARIEAPGPHLAFRDGEETVVVALRPEWTRIGRSLAADIRFDDATVSRRHALIVRRPDGVCLCDDRSLNGVFVNGARVEWGTLHDGDEIVVGRYRLHYLEGAPQGAPTAGEPLAPGA